MSGIFEQVDEVLLSVFADWNIYTTIILAALIAIFGYGIATATESDVHPLILSRQATAGLVRNPKESAVHRSPDVPHGYPLRSGLDVRDREAKSWQPGRDGDLRDIWRRVTGELPFPPKPSTHGQTAPVEPEADVEGSRLEILSVFGKEKVVEHDIAELTKEIAVIGSYAKSRGKTVLIYMPNSVELLVALFACAYYGLDAVLYPYSQVPLDAAATATLIKTFKADVLIARASTLSLEAVSNTSLKQVIWFVETTSRQVDWTEVPKQAGSSLEVDAWHELVQNHVDAPSLQLPTLRSEELGTVTFVWQTSTDNGLSSPVTFTQKNLVAAIAAQIHALPPRQRLSPSDLFFPAAPLTTSHALVTTLAALFSHASIALNSAVLPGIDLDTVTRSFAPTVIVTTAETAANIHKKGKAEVAGGLSAVFHGMATRTLEGGTFVNPSLSGPGAEPGKLRLLIVAERAGTDNPLFSADDLNDLRVFKDARVVYALTAAKVAGAVAQTNVFDYRRQADGKSSHFGVPLSSVEVKVVDFEGDVTTEREARGHIVVSGPAVAGGETNLKVLGRFREDATLAYV